MNGSSLGRPAAPLSPRRRVPVNGVISYIYDRNSARIRPEEIGALKNDWYFFLFFIVSIAFSVGLLGFIALIRYRRRPVGDKCEPYECGVEPATPTARESTSIRFYLLTLAFLVFEVETFLLFPWAVAHDRLGLFGFVEVLVFLAILLVGYVYAWKAGALEFRRGDE